MVSSNKKLIVLRQCRQLRAPCVLGNLVGCCFFLNRFRHLTIMKTFGRLHKTRLERDAQAYWNWYNFNQDELVNFVTARSRCARAVGNFRLRHIAVKENTKSTFVALTSLFSDGRLSLS